MKYEEEEIVSTAQPTAAEKDIAASAAETVYAADEMTLSGDSPVDKLQAAVYRTGTQLEPILTKAIDSLKNTADNSNTSNTNPTNFLNTALKELGYFSYNVGFAGGQSCGKSTVINSLLQYPLMPTCNLPTTASVVKLSYAEHFRVCAIDGDTQNIVLDFDCEMPEDPSAQEEFRKQFAELLDYGVSAMNTLIIENFQYFTDVDVKNSTITVKDVEMTPEDPKQVMLLLFILLAVYVGQNSPVSNDKTRLLMEKRRELFAHFGISGNTINLSVKSLGPFEVLKSGLVITDLPGLGSNAEHWVRPDGREIKGHDEITKEAIQHTDSIVFLAEPEMRRDGFDIIPEMLSGAKLKETVCKGDRIIPVLNKADVLGKQQINTTIETFLAELKKGNVEKEPEEIRRYAGIFGEYRFKDFPFERTLFFKSNYDEESLRKRSEKFGRNFEAEKAAKIENLMLDLEEQYEKSGIDELQDFFRTEFIEIGKYNKSIVALQALRGQVMDIVSRLDSTMKICQNRMANHTGIQDDLIQQINHAIDAPITETFLCHDSELKAIRADFQRICQENQKVIAEEYFNAFVKALIDYKNTLLNTLDKFELSYLTNNARIDQPGSRNRSYYNELLEQVDNFSISLIDVNLRYQEFLKSIRDRIDRLYGNTINDLSSLKESIRLSLENSIAAAETIISPEELTALKSVKNQLIVLVEKQIEITALNLESLQQEEADTVDRVLSAILKLNTKVTKAFAEAIKSQILGSQTPEFTLILERLQQQKEPDTLDKVLSAILKLNTKVTNAFPETIKSQIFGSQTPESQFLHNRQYLPITGENGMMQAVKDLWLSEVDKANLSQSLEAEVTEIFMHKVPLWFDRIDSIVAAYRALNLRIKKPLQEIIEVMNGSIEDSSNRLRAAKLQILAWCNTCHQYNEEVHPFLETARAYMKDQEASNQWLEENIFYNCFDNEIEDEYERERNAQ